MKYLIDYFMFVIKPDKHSASPFNIQLDYLLKILKLDEIFPSFFDIGARMHYEQCFLYENIRIYTASHDDFEDMGYCVEMTGSGCRYYEQLMQNYAGLDVEWSWVDLFKRLRQLVDYGCSLNINRIDFAFDDFDGKLHMQTIEDCAKQREYVSKFRSCKALEEHEKCAYTVNADYTKFGVGKTIYFGSRKSNTFCRFYDKLVEQKKHYQYDLQQLEKLEKLSHWVRFEIVFKRAVAIKIINAMIKLNEKSFNIWLSEVINGYLRFVDVDNNNVTRCTLKKWWSDFLGVVERSKLTCVGLSTNAFNRALTWFVHSVAPTLSAIVHNVGYNELQNLIDEYGSQERWQPKHYYISTADSLTDVSFSSKQIWEALVPSSLNVCSV